MSPEMREYFRELGRRRGNALKEKYGSDYFRQIAAKRKTFGAQKKKDSSEASHDDSKTHDSKLREED